MPELPEVETVRRGLSGVLAGRVVERVDVTGRRSVRRDPEGFAPRLAGLRIDRVDRHGKFLLARLSDGGVLVLHLRMSGQLLAAAADEPLAPHTHVVLHLGGDGPDQLRFVDPRTFGELFLSASPAGDDGLPAELAHLGPDGLDPRVDGAYLARRLRGRRAPLKALLLDQRVVAGVGNIYGDEILHVAGLRPLKPGGDVGPRHAGRLADALHLVLAEAVEAGGSSLGDEQYVDVHGQGGRYQERHRAYGRGGLPCPTCGTPLRRAVLGGRSATWCPRCQR